MAQAFVIGDQVRYRPGFTYGYEPFLEADGRVPGEVVGFSPTRVRVRFALAKDGITKTLTRSVDAASLRRAADAR